MIPLMPGSKVRNHDVLAQEWFYDLMTRPNMSIKVKCKLHDMRILIRIVRVRSTEQFVWHLLTLTAKQYQRQKTIRFFISGITILNFKRKAEFYMITAIISIAVLAAVIVSCVVAVVAGVIGSKNHDEDDI
jgi:hypothetical protein